MKKSEIQSVFIKKRKEKIHQHWRLKINQR